MDKEISPEERLLHLIKVKKMPNMDVEHAAEEPQDIPDLSDNIVPVPVSSGADSIKDKNEHQPFAAGVNSDKSKLKIFPAKPRININPTYIVIAIILISISAVLYFIFNLAGAKDDQEVENLKKLIASISETGQPDSPGPEEKAPVQDKKPVAQDKTGASFDEYQKLINAKAIFASPVTGMRKASVPEGPSLNDLTKDLKLVGIMPGDIPQAIIEDKKNNQTLFLKEGETINDIKIKNISTGKVVLARNDEIVTLSL